MFVRIFSLSLTELEHYLSLTSPEWLKKAFHSKLYKFFSFHVSTTSTIWRLSHFLLHIGLFWCFHNPANSDKVYRILTLHVYIYTQAGTLVYSHLCGDRDHTQLCLTWISKVHSHSVPQTLLNCNLCWRRKELLSWRIPYAWLFGRIWGLILNLANGRKTNVGKLSRQSKSYNSAEVAQSTLKSYMANNELSTNYI